MFYLLLYSFFFLISLIHFLLYFTSHLFPSFYLSITVGMSSEHIEVRRLVDSIAKLMKPLLNRPTALPAPSTTAAAAPSTPEVAVVRQWQQGKGVVVLEDSLASNGQAEKKVEKVEKKKEDRLLSMLKDAPKPEKIGMALFGLQVHSYFLRILLCLPLTINFLLHFLTISCFIQPFCIMLHLSFSYSHLTYYTLTLYRILYTVGSIIPSRFCTYNHGCSGSLREENASHQWKNFR
jgi:hypothetical protein